VLMKPSGHCSRVGRKDDKSLEFSNTFASHTAYHKCTSETGLYSIKDGLTDQSDFGQAVHALSVAS